MTSPEATSCSACRARGMTARFTSTATGPSFEPEVLHERADGQPLGDVLRAAVDGDLHGKPYVNTPPDHDAPRPGGLKRQER